jgi:putative RecB family exonuclease
VGSPTLTAMTECPAAADAPEAEAPAPQRPALSPSRAADFKQCPLLYRFRAIDRLPEVPGRTQVRGTLVHAVLERLFDLDPGERTLQAASALVEPEWQRLLETEPALSELFDEPEQVGPWLSSAVAMLDGYFTLEDPNRLQPAEREQLVEVVLESGLQLRGFVDRLDVAPTGDIRVVDYKTGAAPRESFEGKALFQLKFYALVIWRTRGVVPRQLRLLYLGDREVLDYAPDPDELLRFERTVQALWTAIERATAAKDFRPNRSRLCDWCDHQALCPEFGGTPPPFPETVPEPADEPTLSPAAQD